MLPPLVRRVLSWWTDGRMRAVTANGGEFGMSEDKTRRLATSLQGRIFSWGEGVW